MRPISRASAVALVEGIEFLSQEEAGAPLKEEMLGHLVDQDFFIDADGLVFFDEGGEELVSVVVGFIVASAECRSKGRGGGRSGGWRLCRRGCEVP